MIGVIAKETETRAAQEFFQLFKTPWEFYVPDHAYDLVLVTTEEVPFQLAAKVVVIFNSKRLPCDGEIEVQGKPGPKAEWLVWNNVELPLYGDCMAFQTEEQPFVQRRDGAGGVGVVFEKPMCLWVRVGYDLFREIAFLLSQGQPAENATVPALELHISLLRGIMIRTGVPFIEIPPVPAGFEFMACMTHDVDFTGIREHKFDYTMAGFVYRALVGSTLDALRGRAHWSRCWANWQSVLKLPFVYLGWIDDFWLEFDRYSSIEAGLGSTYYFIPFKDCPGTQAGRTAPAKRAAKYDLMATKDEVSKLRENGCEVGVHGIDAWHSSDKGKTELQRIREITRQEKVGIRMHWLYFDRHSPKELEEAGFAYDSTFGYNDAIGFRAGTSQVFCIPPADSLLELPLIIQDTAMLYPGRMHLTEAEAIDLCRRIIGLSSEFGGVLTVNWHTRSLSPERLWGDFYLRLLQEIRQNRVWFGTAQDIINWFQGRRAIQFNHVEFTEEGVRIRISGVTPNGELPFLVRVYRANAEMSSGSTTAAPAYSDTPWKGEPDLNIASTGQEDSSPL